MCPPESALRFDFDLKQPRPEFARHEQPVGRLADFAERGEAQHLALEREGQRADPLQVEERLLADGGVIRLE